MKKFCLIIILLVFLGVLVTGCSTTATDQQLQQLISENGIQREYQMVRIEHYETIQGSVQLHSYFFSASLDANIHSEPALQFYWSPKKGETIATVLPYSKFRFIIDDTKSTPTIEFLFDTAKLLYDKNVTAISNDVHRLYLKLREHKLQNPNEIVMSKYLDTAIVRISSSTLKTEIYLPK